MSCYAPSAMGDTNLLSSADGRIHGFTHMFKRPAVGVTLVAAPPDKAMQMQDFVRTRPPLRTYEHRADEWYTISMLVENGELNVTAVTPAIGRWVYDAESEAAASHLVGFQRMQPGLSKKERRRRRKRF